MPANDDTRRELAKQARLWLLSLICATAGALTIWRTNQLTTGILVFLATLTVLGSLLWATRSPTTISHYSAGHDPPGPASGVREAKR